MEEEEVKKVIKRDSNGRFLPGTAGFTGKRSEHGKGKYLTDIIKLKFGEELEVWVDEYATTRVQRREIMAEALAQLISTGEIKLPDRYRNGKHIRGKLYSYNKEEYLSHLLKVLRYVEPPVQQVELSGGVDGVVFDNEFFDQALEQVQSEIEDKEPDEGELD
jgi:hypothetical protein